MWPGQLTKGEDKSNQVSFLGDGRSLVSLGLLVTCACRSGLNNRNEGVGVSGVYAAGWTLTPNFRQQIQTLMQRRARTKNTSTTQNTKRDEQVHTYNKAQLKIQIYIFQTTREIQRRPTNRGRTFGPNMQTFCFARGPVGANTTGSELRDKTMLGVLNGAECLLLTHFRGVPVRRLIPMPATQNCVCAH